jgi:hypothetical protein
VPSQALRWRWIVGLPVFIIGWIRSTAAWTATKITSTISRWSGRGDKAEKNVAKTISPSLPIETADLSKPYGLWLLLWQAQQPGYSPGRNVAMWIERMDAAPGGKLPEKRWVRGGWESRQAIPLILPYYMPRSAFLVVHEHQDSSKMTLSIEGMEEDDCA